MGGSNRHAFLATPCDPGPCRIWPGALNSRGYGSIGNGHGGTVLAHRLAYELHVGPIPAGLTIDHLCRVKQCVNPAHLEVVTREENSRRVFQGRTHCQRGHELTGDNLRIHRRTSGRTSTECRTCSNATLRRHALARRALQAAKANS